MKIVFPQKSDYPFELSVLKKKGTFDEYFQLLESSASAYFETDVLTRYFFLKRFKKTLELIQSLYTDDRKLEILDAGCGIGFLLPSLSRVAKNIWAVDNARHSLSYAEYMCQKRGIKNVRFRSVNLENPEKFTEEKFDLIICLSVLEHIKNLEKALSFFESMLKREGSLIAGFPNEDNFIFKLLQTLEKKFFRPKVYKTLQGSKLVHVSKAKTIGKIMKRYFKTEKDETINIFPGISLYILKKYTLKG